jgi:hypothetical protein
MALDTPAVVALVGFGALVLLTLGLFTWVIVQKK